MANRPLLMKMEGNGAQSEKPFGVGGWVFLIFTIAGSMPFSDS